MGGLGVAQKRSPKRWVKSVCTENSSWRRKFRSVICWKLDDAGAAFLNIYFKVNGESQQGFGYQSARIPGSVQGGINETRVHKVHKPKLTAEPC